MSDNSTPYSVLPYLVCHFWHVQREKEKIEKEKMEEKEESVKKRNTNGGRYCRTIALQL